MALQKKVRLGEQDCVHLPGEMVQVYILFSWSRLQGIKGGICPPITTSPLGGSQNWNEGVELHIW